MAAAAATEADDGDDPTGFRRVILFVYLFICVSVLALVLVLLFVFFTPIKAVLIGKLLRSV